MFVTEMRKLVSVIHLFVFSKYVFECYIAKQSRRGSPDKFFFNSVIHQGISQRGVRNCPEKQVDSGGILRFK